MSDDHVDDPLRSQGQGGGQGCALAGEQGFVQLISVHGFGRFQHHAGNAAKWVVEVTQPMDQSAERRIDSPQHQAEQKVIAGGEVAVDRRAPHVRFARPLGHPNLGVTSPHDAATGGVQDAPGSVVGHLQDITCRGVNDRNVWESRTLAAFSARTKGSTIRSSTPLRLSRSPNLLGRRRFGLRLHGSTELSSWTSGWVNTRTVASSTALAECLVDESNGRCGPAANCALHPKMRSSVRYAWRLSSP